ncbi:hypothetical protein K440DRAFT_394421 [Wilcoxina mikolae CBS 423.85]|nr:hypothetical protein K440DRAFT_394421 [Wilcoxina mikolae CBS 423.85]
MNPCRAYPSTSTSTSNSRLSRSHQSSPAATWNATYLLVLFIALLSSFFSLGPSRSRQPRRSHSNAVHRHTTIRTHIHTHTGIHTKYLLSWHQRRLQPSLLSASAATTTTPVSACSS